MRLTLLYSIAILLLGIVPAAAQSQTTDAQFFTSLQDMPLMPGLVELPEHTLQFDKPQGRIIESAALIEQGSEESVRNYYAATLPQLGWQKYEPNTYTRHDEILRLRFETLESEHFLILTVMPRG